MTVQMNDEVTKFPEFFSFPQGPSQPDCQQLFPWCHVPGGL